MTKQYTIRNNRTAEVVCSADSRREAELYIKAYGLQSFAYVSAEIRQAAGRSLISRLESAAPLLLAGFIGAIVAILAGV